MGGRENLSREQLVEIIERLERRIAALEAENADLKRRLAAASKDSSTSSKPPSSDIVKPPLPPEVRGAGLLGPNLTALVGWLKACGHVSYRRIGEFFGDVLNLPISGGHLAACCTGKLSEALRPAYEELASALRQEAVLGSDETGHYHGGERYWTWCLRAARFTVFRLDATRAAKVLVALLGEDFAGILTVDYWYYSQVR
jgi:hypothetical protein